MRVVDLFETTYGHSLELNALSRHSNGINFVSRSAKNNGVTARVIPITGINPGEAGALTVALGGSSVLSVFVQPQPFYCGRDVAILTARRPMSAQEKLWWAMCIHAQRYRYSYGRQANRTLETLGLPDEMPDWAESVDLPDYARLAEATEEASVPLTLDTSAWRAFPYQDVFDIVQGERVTKQEIYPGSTPFVRASQFQNGVVGYFDLPKAHPGGVITVPYNGSVAEAFYQPDPFFASDDVFVLTPKGSASPNAALFLCAVIRLEKDRFGYGYKWNMERMRKTAIKLPVTLDGTPDWSLMDRYMASLPFSAITADRAG